MRIATAMLLLIMLSLIIGLAVKAFAMDSGQAAAIVSAIQAGTYSGNDGDYGDDD